MKAKFTPKSTDTERKYPCFLVAKLSKRLILAFDADNAIVMSGSDYLSSTDPANKPLYVMKDKYRGEFSKKNIWGDAAGTLVIKLP